jgi:hypothetical protein
MHVAKIRDDGDDDDAEGQVKSLTPAEVIALSPANRMHQLRLFEDDPQSLAVAAERILQVIQAQTPRYKPGRRVGDGKRTVVVYD